ncbi:MAG TPA: response regulator [Thermoanaerobaculia bacterium]|nr:response regulator [Thermoanaerobaculia bacterium]
MSIRLLGDVSAVDYRGNALSIGNRRTQALIVYLALKSRPTFSEIGRLLFDDPNAVVEVRELVRDLRYALRFLPPEVLKEENDHVRFNRDVVDVDAQSFNDLIAAPSLNSIRKASELYRGDLCAGFVTHIHAFDAWIAERRLSCQRAAAAIFGNLLTTLIRAGWWEEAVDVAGRLLSVDPAQEVVHRTLMRLQLEQGRPDAALRRYQECVEVLRREHNREPDAETERVRREIERALDQNPAPRDVSRTPRTNGPVLILLVEDDLVSTALMEGYLTDGGYDVVAVSDGGAALIELGRRGFDMLILDINLPTLSGTKVFEIMTQKLIDTPALFVTGMPGTEVETQSLEMGAAGFLRKPVQKDVLLQKIRGILQRSRRDSISR